jgi:hypothetical protein
MNRTGFGYPDEHRPSFVAALVIVLALAAASLGCLTASAQRKLIDTLNEAQLAAAQTYDAAVVAQTKAQMACADVLRGKGAPLPGDPAVIRPTCASVGAPVPYDPVWLQKAAGPINALYDALRAANAQRTAGTGEAPPEVLGRLLGGLEGVLADLAAAGIAVPKSVTDAVATVKAAGVTP